MDDNQKIPGEKIASIEEYLPGDNTFEDNDSIRATTIGKSNLYGSDIIKESLDAAKKNSNKTIKYFLDDITQENTTDLLSDVIVSVGVFQIYDEIEKILLAMSKDSFQMDPNHLKIHMYLR